jgi:glycosyltransferase involved in cell wall biosynthesis
LRMLWMHDVNVGPTFEGPFGDRRREMDVVVGLTDWHINHLKKLYGVPDKVLAKIPNGINLERFKQVGQFPPRRQDKFIWSSSPDRGIDVMLGMWEEIRDRWNHAELHVYYGWNTIDKIIEMMPDHQLVLFKNGVEDMLDYLGREEAGIYWHNRVGQGYLAQQMLTSDIWAYPTYFLETFCITALEMQAAGVIPLTSNIGGLIETNPRDSLRVSGWPNNKSYRKQYIETLEHIKALPAERTSLIRENGRDIASRFTWDAAYQRWLQVIADGGVDTHREIASAAAS